MAKDVEGVAGRTGSGALARALASVSASRIEERIGELAAIGSVPGDGVTRLALTPEEQRARQTVRGWLEPIGFRSRQDDAGNLFCRLGEGPAVLVGSHLDSVPDGGRFDGALGVVAAAEVGAAAADSGLPLAVEVVAWTGEEGVRFGTGLFGSAAAFGQLPAGAWDRPDQAGITAARAARALLGREPDPSEGAGLDPASIRAYLELHIEQGSRLAEAGLPIGVVESIVGIFHGVVTVEGEADHAGTTRMGDRLDALAGAAEAVLWVERAAGESDGALVATVGEIAVSPGAKNVIPGACSFSLDVRSADDEVRAMFLDALQGAVGDICGRRGLAWRIDPMDHVPAVPMPAEVRKALARAAAGIGLDAPELVSYAGHDAQSCARAGIPSGMVFVRSTGGSHNPREHASAEDAALGARVVLAAALGLAGGLSAG